MYITRFERWFHLYIYGWLFDKMCQTRSMRISIYLFGHYFSSALIVFVQITNFIESFPKNIFGSLCKVMNAFHVKWFFLRTVHFQVICERIWGNIVFDHTKINYYVNRFLPPHNGAVIWLLSLICIRSNFFPFSLIFI